MCMKPARLIPPSPSWGFSAFAVAVSGMVIVPYVLAACVGLGLRQLFP